MKNAGNWKSFVGHSFGSSVPAVYRSSFRRIPHNLTHTTLRSSLSSRVVTRGAGALRAVSRHEEKEKDMREGEFTLRTDP